MPTDASLVRRLRFVGVLGALVMVGALSWGLYARARDAGETRAWAFAHSIPMVRVVEPKAVQSAETLDLPGVLQAYNEAPIYARVSGYLKSWNEDIGAHVRQGQVLAVIDAPELDQQLAAAKADLAAAKANLQLAKVTAERFGDLASDDAVSKQDADEKSGAFQARDAAVQAAQANVQRLEALEGFKRIAAPLDGVVTQRNANIGALVNAGAGSTPSTALFTVADVHRLRVYVQVPQSSSAVIRPGMAAELQLPQYPNRRFSAQVVSDAGAMSNQNGALLVELQVANDDGALKPGDYAQVRFSIPGGAGGLRAPASALMFRRRGLEIATTGTDGRAHLHAVSISRDFGGEVELSGGLTPGALVIDTPPDSLEDGDVVRIAPRATTAGARDAARS